MGCIKFLACANFTVDTAQKIKFSIKVFFSKCVSNLVSNLVTFTEEILQGKLHFFVQ